MARAKKQKLEAQAEAQLPETGDGPECQDISQWELPEAQVEVTVLDEAGNPVVPSDGVNEPAAAPDEQPTGEVAPVAKGEKKLSGVAACAQVLANHVAAGGANEMGVAEMVKTAIDQGLWLPAGLTPAATANSAIARDIKISGDKSLFVKAGRGKYSLRTE